MKIHLITTVKKQLAVALTLLVAGTVLAANMGAPAIVPAPQKMAVRPGTFELTASTRISYQDSVAPEAEQLLARLKTCAGFQLTRESLRTSGMVSVRRGGSVIEVLLVTNEVARLGAEGYILDVQPSRVALTAGSSAGVFYGVQTLLQLLPPDVFAGKTVKDVKWQIPCVEITDSPRFPWRGMMLDVSRHFLTVDEVKKFLDLMALHKLNTLHFHLTDDQGWRLEIKKYPELTKHGSIRKESPKPGNRNVGDGTPYGPFFYTQAQIRDLVAYAQARHITIVPEIEMPGHVLGVLSAHPELSCRGVPLDVRTRWGVEVDVLCVGNPKSLEFMKDILAETMELFPGRFVHIGGDESPRERWKTCPKCQALLKSEGLTKEAQLQTWFNQRIEKFLAEHGRRLIGWDEILEGGLTPGAAVMSWRGMGGGTEAAEQGHDVVMTPTSHCYLDYGQGKGPNEPEVIGGYVPLQTVYALEPVPSKLPQEKRAHILGTQGNLWAEYLRTAKDFEYNGFPRACALAEVAWTPAEQKDFKQFTARLQTHLQRLDRLNVNYRRLDAPPVGEWTPAQITATGATVDWDVSGVIKAPGNYQAVLDYTQGKHGIDIAWVALLENGQEVDRDVHAGFAGGKPRGTSYSVKLPALKPGARYTLRAQVAGNGGTDSQGVVSFNCVSNSSASKSK